MNFSRCAEVCKTYVQEAPRKKEKTGSSRVERKEKKKKRILLAFSLSLLSSSPRLSFWLLNYRNGASPPSPPASPLSRRGRGRGRSTCCCGRGCSCSLTRGASRPRSIEKKEKNPLFFSIRAPRQMQQERRVLYLLRKLFRSISAFPSTESSSLAPGAANSKNRALLIERKARCCFWCRSPSAIIKIFASHTTRTRARSRPRPRAFNNSPEAREIKLAENSIRAER